MSTRRDFCNYYKKCKRLLNTRHSCLITVMQYEFFIMVERWWINPYPANVENMVSL
jgi:hypothetical protein